MRNGTARIPKALLSRPLVRILLVYLLLVGGLAVFQDNLIYVHPSQSRCDWELPEQNNWVTKIRFESEDGTQLEGWFATPSTDAVATLLFCHGNGENIATQGNELRNLCQQLGFEVFIFDYRGFGNSGGRCSEEGLLMDGRAAMRELNRLTETTPADVIVFGRSLGGGVAVHVATEMKAKGLILNATYSAIDDVAANKFWWLPVRPFLRTRMRSVDWVKDYQGPLLCAHGTNDKLIPLWSGIALFDACPSADKTFYSQQGSGHHDSLNRDFYIRMGQFALRLQRDKLPENASIVGSD